MYCAHCGTKNEDAAAECIQCKKSLNKTSMKTEASKEKSLKELDLFTKAGMFMKFEKLITPYLFTKGYIAVALLVSIGVMMIFAGQELGITINIFILLAANVLLRIIAELIIVPMKQYEIIVKQYLISRGYADEDEMNS